MKYANSMLIVLSLVAGQAWGYEPNPTGISVEGEASQSVAPDILTFTIGINTHGKTLDKILASNLSSVNRVVKALLAHSILEKDIKTSHQSFNKHLRPGVKDGWKTTIHDGFDATTMIGVVLRDFSHYDSLLKTLVNDPDTSLYGFKLEVSRADNIRLRLIEKAYQNAHRKAEILVGASGATLGKARFINLDVNNPDDWASGGGALFGIEENDDSNLMPGQILIEVEVDVVFALE